MDTKKSDPSNAADPEKLPTRVDPTGIPPKPGGNRKQRLAQGSHDKRLKKKIAKALGDQTSAAVGVLVDHRAILARVLSCVIDKLGDGRVELTKEDLDNARNLRLLSTEADASKPTVLIVEGTDSSGPLTISIEDLVKRIGIG